MYTNCAADHACGQCPMPAPAVPSLGSPGGTPDITALLTYERGRRWWNVNQPQDYWTDECPAYLQNQSPRIIAALLTRDEDFKIPNWERVKSLVAAGQIDRFGRLPSQLRRYEKYCYDLKQQHGSILHYVQRHRLGWPSITASGDTPFTNSADFKILYNDWPYALGPGVKHLVVWTKFSIGEEDETGHLTEKSTQEVEAFVVRWFCTPSDGNRLCKHDKGVPRKHLAWFKNWKGLRSVSALEHIHVLLYQPTREFVDAITQGDVPVSEMDLDTFVTSTRTGDATGACCKAS